MRLSASPSATVYVVDDDEAVRESVMLLLEVHGFEVRDFADARSFIEAEKPLEHLDGRNCCLLVDLHMPGMNGAELLEYLQTNDQQIPAIVLTGRSSATMLERVERAGAICLLEKPAEEDELTSQIALALSFRGRRGSV